MLNVLCFGEALVDRLGPPGGDPAGDRSSSQDVLGGAPANVACALAHLGTASALLGRLGRDAIGERFRVLLARRAVDTAGLQWDERRPSRIVLVSRDARGERTFGGFCGDRGEGFADQAICADQLPAALFRGARWLLFGTIPLASPVAAEALERALALAKAEGLQLALDVNWRPSFWPDPAQAVDRVRPLLDQVQLLKLAAEEADWLFRSRDPAVVSAALPQGPAVVISDGAAGARWSLGGDQAALPAFAVDVVDTTGAGDAFLAGLLHGLSETPDLLRQASPAEALDLFRFASACGALVCSGAGAIAPQPSRHAVAAFLNSNPH
ncbi:MAG: carbohydrate kinase [Aphanocapsa feldmannii 288cV]|nr:MAG: carbohydrate kinase [Aphanocapsa feldmannii 288cV]